MQMHPFVASRLGGAAAVLGGLAWAAKAFHDRNDAPPWPTDVTDAVSLVVLPLFLAGLTGLYGSCRTRLGKWRAISLAAFALGVFGLGGSLAGLGTAVLGAGPSSWSGIAWWTFAFGLFLTNLCLVFLGNSVFQCGALPRWNALPLTIGSVGILLALIGDPPNSHLGVYPSLALWMSYGFGWAALGSVLWSGQPAASKKLAERPTRRAVGIRSARLLLNAGRRSNRHPSR